MRKLVRSFKRAVNFLILWTIASIAILVILARVFESPFRQYLWLIPVLTTAYLFHKAIQFFLFRSSKYLNSQGYVVLSETNELEHRAIAKEIIGRELLRNEVVHHINGKRDDNRIINLCLMDHEKHEHFHSWLKWKKEKTGSYPSFRNQKRVLREEYGGTLLEYETKKPHRSFVDRPNWIKESDLASESIVSTPKPSPKVLAKNLPEERTLILTNDQQRILFVQLRDERKRLSELMKIPAYNIFIDKTLLKMAQRMPISRHAMLEIPGVTDEKYEAYGPYFVELIRRFKLSLLEKKDPA